MRWLARVAQHVVIDTARYHGRRQRQAGEQVPLTATGTPGGHEPADSRTPSRLLRESEDLRALLAQLDALPHDYREVILLSKLEGLSTAEVAERLGRTRQATALLLHRAVKRLREIRERLPQT
jgi:RNA polymerase sigma factor (sigma-70 family)